MIKTSQEEYNSNAENDRYNFWLDCSSQQTICIQNKQFHNNCERLTQSPSLKLLWSSYSLKNLLIIDMLNNITYSSGRKMNPFEANPSKTHR